MASAPMRSGASRGLHRRGAREGDRPDNGLAAPSGTPGPLGVLANAGFRALSAVRGRRIFHPVGVGYAATLRVPAAVPGLTGVRLFEAPGEHEAICRFSRGGGLP